MPPKRNRPDNKMAPQLTPEQELAREAAYREAELAALIEKEDARTARAATRVEWTRKMRAQRAEEKTRAENTRREVAKAIAEYKVKQEARAAEDRAVENMLDRRVR